MSDTDKTPGLGGCVEQPNKSTDDQHLERRRLLRRGYALDVPILVMSDCDAIDSRQSDQNHSNHLRKDSDMVTEETMHQASNTDSNKRKAATLACEVQLSCDACGSSIPSSSYTIQCSGCMQKQPPEHTTLQPPTSRHRCDSGNGSDIIHSSGNVSPAYSDYGGGEQGDRMRRNSSKSSALGPPIMDDPATTPIIPKDQQISSCNLTDNESSLEGATTPTVKLWPVDSTEETQAILDMPQRSNQGSNSKPLISHVEDIKRKEFNWHSSMEHEDWLEEDTSGVGSDLTHSVESIPCTLDDYPNADTLPPGLIRRQTSESLYSRPPFLCQTRRLSEGLGSTQFALERGMSRPSVDSLCSLDDYFSQIHHTHYEFTDSLTDNAFDPHQAAQFEQAPQPPTPSKTKTSPAPGLPSGTPPIASRTNSENGTSSTTSPKPLKRKSLRERLSEKQIHGLKVDVGLKEKVQPSSAPIGDQNVASLFASYSQQPDTISLGSTLHTPNTPYLKQIKDPQKRWQALRGIMPFMDSYKKKKWVQLAGHQDSFEQSSQDSLVLKKFSQLEYAAFDRVLHDPLQMFIPKRYGTTSKNGHKFVELENLLHGFNSPSVMDCKIGTRTYLEEELIKAEKSPTPRQDMYEKMMKINPSEPTEEEHRLQAVSKPRYMQWREKISSTSTLGFRIEGIKCTDGQSCINFKTSKDKLTIKTIISGFLNRDPVILKQYLDRLKDFRDTLGHSEFFRSHEIIGSSLLFVHDGVKAGVWMIDFGKTTPLQEGVAVTHDKQWERGNHEDGYLIGLDNLTTLLQTILEECEAVKSEGRSHITDINSQKDSNQAQSGVAALDAFSLSVNLDSNCESEGGYSLDEDSTTDSDSQNDSTHTTDHKHTTSSTT